MSAAVPTPVPAAEDFQKPLSAAHELKVVYVFGTCLIDLFDPQAGISTIKLLEREGYRVVFPDDQSCCGQPAYTSGFPADALTVAERQVNLFTENWPIVVPSGSCAGMMKHHWPRLFGLDHPLAPKVQSIANRVYEFTDFLVNVLGIQLKDLGQACTVVLHTSCSARREMQVHLSSKALLDQLSNVEVLQQDRAAECCGFGGTFSVRQAGLSAAMANDKADALCATGATRLVSADAGCLANINGILGKRGAPMQGQHLATFIAERIALEGCDQ
jgi:L-lactate dehydrogenase complex protein LldE